MSNLEVGIIGFGSLAFLVSLVFFAFKVQEKMDAKRAASPKGIKQAKILALHEICYNCKGSINTKDQKCPNCGVETLASLEQQSWKKLTITDILKGIWGIFLAFAGISLVAGGSILGTIFIIWLAISLIIELVRYIKKRKEKDKRLLFNQRIEEILNNFDLDSVVNNENQKVVSTTPVQNVSPVQNATPVQNVSPVQNATPVQNEVEFCFCANCGAKLKKSVKFCVACGQKVED